MLKKYNQEKVLKVILKLLLSTGTKHPTVQELSRKSPFLQNF